MAENKKGLGLFHPEINGVMVAKDFQARRTVSFREGTVFSPFLSNSNQNISVAKKGIHK